MFMHYVPVKKQEIKRVETTGLSGSLTFIEYEKYKISIFKFIICASYLSNILFSQVIVVVLTIVLHVSLFWFLLCYRSNLFLSVC